jgi:DNA helicase HerA-like ATPase
MRQDMAGRGIINVLAAEQLILKPRVYSSFLLWMLSELFENLPEVGDLDRPKLVFFFDEAHLLFDDAPQQLQQRVEQVVRLIRSKGVGIYFCSQLPDDVPPVVLGQLGNRIQHALRAFTPRDQKAVKTAAETFPPNPRIDVVETITQLGVGEALVTTLQEGGVPLPVERTLIVPPHCRIGAITDEERATQRNRSPVGAKYDSPMNRDSAFEQLNRLQEEAAAAAQAPAGASAPADAEPTWGARFKEFLFGTKRRQGAIEQVAKSAMRTAGTRMTNQILRGILGGVSGGSRRRR